MIEWKGIIWIIWGFVYLLLTSLNINIEVFGFYILLVFIDLFIGLIKWVILKDLTSKYLFKWILRKTTLIFFILSISFFCKINWYEVTQVISLLFFVLSFWEIYSIIWNIYQIQKKENEKKEFEAITYFFNLLLKFGESFFKNKINSEFKIEEKKEKEKEVLNNKEKNGNK